MAENFNIEMIQEVLRAATSPQGPFTQRSLSKKAHEGRDCVSDILKGRNANPTVKVLTNLAAALGSDLSIFGVMTTQNARREDPVSAEELEVAIREALPAMPRGSIEKRARYLASTVSDALGLPPARPSMDTIAHSTATGGSEATSPPRGPTK